MMTPGKSIAGAMGLVMLALLSWPCWSQDMSSSSTQESSTSHNGKQTYRWRSSNLTTDFNIEMRGKIELTDDDKDIKSISDDGYLEISKTVFGSRRSIVIESLGDGRVKKEYYEGRSKMDWEPNGKAWLAEILPEVVRTSTIGAESRVKRFFNKGGTSAVLSEIGNLENDHVRSHYGNLLMKYPVQTKDYPAIINTLSNDIDSDHYIAGFLSNHVTKFIQHNDARVAAFGATRKMGSDHYKTQVISQLLKGAVTPENLKLALQAAGEMDSDHYKTQIITQALKGSQTSPENIKLTLQAAANMDSDHYITQVITALIDQNNLSDAALSEAINATKALESDHYRTEVLTKAMNKPGISEASHRRVVESVKEMESDHYITQVIMHLMDDKISDGALTNLLDILNSIESDHYRTEILKRIIDRQELNEAQFSKILEASADMGSDHYKRVVLKEALSSAVSNNTFLQILNSSTQIDSDHYLSEVLLSAASKVKSGSSEMKNAYRVAAKSISSETYYGRVLRAIEQ
ncbi:MAG: hypothetical protein WD824_18655 [Cyclobacteriaceae bacterium]